MTQASRETIHDAVRGDPTAVDQLLPLLYDELRALAYKIFGAQGDHTLQPTAVVHEVFLKMVPDEEQNTRHGVNDRAHFLALAAKAMRQVLINHARDRNRIKRGGDMNRITLIDVAAAPNSEGHSLLDLHEALEELSVEDESLAEIATARILAGMTMDELAVIHKTSSRTIERRWRGARAWLRRRLLDATKHDEG